MPRRNRLPSVVSNIPRDLRTFVDRVREVIGDKSVDRFVTIRELVGAGVVSPPTEPGGPPGFPTPPILPPPTPGGLEAAGGFATIILTWDDPTYYGHAFTEVWAAEVDNVGEAVKVGMTTGTVFAHNLGNGATRYYWIRFVNVEDEISAFNATAGTLGQTAQDPEYLIDVLSDEFGYEGEAPFFHLDEEMVIDGTTVPAGTYMKAAWIHNGVIKNAMIGNAAIDSAKIAEVDVNLLTGNALKVGEFIKSANFIEGAQGWYIGADGAAEFQEAVVRGTVYATNGQFFGTLLGGDAETFNTGIGFYSGIRYTPEDEEPQEGDGEYRWRVGAPTGARIEWNGVKISIFDQYDQLVLDSGGVDWDSVLNPPSDIFNTNIELTEDGQLVGAGGGQVSLSKLPEVGAFALLDQLTAANISTYIDTAAIDTAYIKAAAIKTALIDNLAVTRAKIDNLAVGTAQIDDLAVGTAQIQDLAVDTLKIKDNAVTIPVGSSGDAWINRDYGWHPVAWVSLNSEGAPVILVPRVDKIEVSTTWPSYPYADVRGYEVRLRRGSTVLNKSYDVPPDGTNTYYLDVKYHAFGETTGEEAGIPGTIHVFASLSAIGAKK